MSSNDRPETLTPAELREQSESWRRAELRWQAWAARVLAENGKTTKDAACGDESAREKIEALTRRGRTAPSLRLEAAALAYAAAVDALATERAVVVADHVKRTGSNQGALTTRESFDRMRPFVTAGDHAERAMMRAAVALRKAEQRRGKGKP